ncbi:lipoprotein BA_5634 family protein [Bacillus pseudomycoides]
MVDGKKMKYEGNVIIGDARKYADMYTIVSDVSYQTISQSVSKNNWGSSM